MTGESGVLNPS